MGRILRLSLAEDTPTRVDLAMIRPGKLLIKNTSATIDVRIGYDTVGGIGDGAGLAGAVNSTRRRFVSRISPSIGFALFSMLPAYEPAGILTSGRISQVKVKGSASGSVA